MRWAISFFFFFRPLIGVVIKRKVFHREIDTNGQQMARPIFEDTQCLKQRHRDETFLIKISDMLPIY